MRMFVEAKPAGAIIFVREAAAGKGWEVLMGLRNSTDDFVPGAYVFAGGARSGVDVALARHLLALTGEKSEETLALKITSIRESFEEMGILLAYDDDGALVSLQPTAQTEDEERPSRLAGYRRRLLAGETSAFCQMLQAERLVLALDALHFLARWVTPPLFPRRYDAHFFIARMPPKQAALPDGNEIVGHLWLSPDEILARHDRRELPLVYPTLMTIKELARNSRVEALVKQRVENGNQMSQAP